MTPDSEIKVCALYGLILVQLVRQKYHISNVVFSDALGENLRVQCYIRIWRIMS